MVGKKKNKEKNKKNKTNPKIAKKQNGAQASAHDPL
jgi:hypothetical protein